MIVPLVLWYLASAGFALVVGHSTVTLPLRRWLSPVVPEPPLSKLAEIASSPDPIAAAHAHLDSVPRGAFRGSRLLCELLECPMCLGVWCGGIAAVTNLVHTPYSLPVAVAVLAFSTSAVNFAFGRATGAI